MAYRILHCWVGDYSPVRPDEDEDPEVGNFTQIGFSRPEGIRVLWVSHTMGLRSEY